MAWTEISGREINALNYKKQFTSIWWKLSQLDNLAEILGLLAVVCRDSPLFYCRRRNSAEWDLGIPKQIRIAMEIYFLWDLRIILNDFTCIRSFIDCVWVLLKVAPDGCFKSIGFDMDELPALLADDEVADETEDMPKNEEININLPIKKNTQY